MYILCKTLAYDNRNLLVATGFLTCDRIGIKNSDFIEVNLCVMTGLAPISDYSIA